MTRFVVVAHSRSGSTMLETALRSHSRIEVYGEVFHDAKRVRRDLFPGDLRILEDSTGELRVWPRARYYKDGECGEKFLREAVFYTRSLPGAISVGFRLFYQHAKSPEAATAWRYLQDDTQVHIIHLVRNDLLGSWISHQIAQKTGVWFQELTKNNPSPSIAPFVGNVAACVKYIRTILRYRAMTRAKFCRHSYLEVCYEVDLCQQYSETVNAIQNFLNVPNEDIHPATKMQRAYEQSQILLNYSQMKTAIENVTS